MLPGSLTVVNRKGRQQIVADGGQIRRSTFFPMICFGECTPTYLITNLPTSLFFKYLRARGSDYFSTCR